ncbi:MAG: RNA methyltransferase [Flavobacteriales bacterium]|nr:RNA methyltransferase [Flavobacteriales bacterium]
MQLSHAKKKWIKSLQLKKFRDEHGVFVAEGEKVIHDILASGGVPEMMVKVKDKPIELSHYPLSFFTCNDADMASISSLTTPPGVLAVFKKWSVAENILEKLPPRWLITDGIKDPGNMGTLIRTAHWFGVNAIIALNSSVDEYNPKTVQSTMGSLGRVPVFHEDADSFYARFAGKVSFLGADLDGKSLYETKPRAEFALIIGSESHGLSEISKKYLTEKIFIPSHHPENRPESLNAAVSAGIILSVISVQ